MFVGNLARRCCVIEEGSPWQNQGWEGGKGHFLMQYGEEKQIPWY